MAGRLKTACQGEALSLMLRMNQNPQFWFIFLPNFIGQAAQNGVQSKGIPTPLPPPKRAGNPPAVRQVR
jgi:hypothetical protein